MKTNTYLGFDIGGTKCAVCLAREAEGSVQILAREAFPTADTRLPAPTIDRLLTIADALLQQQGLSAADLQAAGISCGGPLDSRNGLVLSPPNLPGWDRVPLVERISGYLNIPTYLENDANACAVAEWQWGAGRGCRDMAFLTFGTGLGAGLIVNGQLCRGASDMAGEAGHIRMAATGPVGYGKPGSLEGFCSGGGIAKAALASGFPTGTDARQIFALAAEGSPAARAIVEETGRQLGKGLAILIDLLNPERVVLGGLFLRQEAVLRPLLEEEVQKEALALSTQACKIVPAQLGESIGDYGAAAAALAGRMR